MQPVNDIAEVSLPVSQHKVETQTPMVKHATAPTQNGESTLMQHMISALHVYAPN